MYPKGETFSLKNKFGSKNNKILIEAVGDFTFIYHYTATSKSETFEEIKNGQSIMFYYTDDLPARFYAKIGNIDEPILASFKLKDITPSFTPTTESKELIVTGYVTDSVSIFKRLKDKTYIMNQSEKIEGNYDSSMSVGTVVFTPEQISKGIKSENERYIYVEITKKNAQQQFLAFYISGSIFPTNNKERIAPQREYIVGSLEKEQKEPNVHLIKRTEDVFNMVKLDISMNSEKIDFAYSDIGDTDITKNSTSLKEQITSSKDEFGKTTIIFDLKNRKDPIKLSFFPKKDEIVTDSNSLFYAFKYYGGTSFKDYSVTNKTLDVFKEVKGDVTSLQVLVSDTFKNDGQVAPGQYHLKIFNSTTKYSIKSIINPKDCLFDYIYKVKEGENVTKFNFTVPEIKEGTYYISVIAVLNENSEMFSYDNTTVTVEAIKGGLSVWVIIIICIICIIVVVVLAFLIYKVIKKRNLKEEVNKTSFNDGINTNLLTHEGGNSLN